MRSGQQVRRKCRLDLANRHGGAGVCLLSYSHVTSPLYIVSFLGGAPRIDTNQSSMPPHNRHPPNKPCPPPASLRHHETAPRHQVAR